METKKQPKSGDFKESRDRFTRIRGQKPSKEEVLSILEKGTKRPTDDSNRKTAKDRDAQV